MVLMSLPLSSCGQQESAGHPVVAKTVPSEQPQPYQRFIPVPRQPENLTGTPWSGAFALDTKTGQLCFTYNTNVKGWDGLPQCLQLLKDYPDTQAATSSAATDATVQKLLDKYK
jgi:hypothetical protein